ncbi:MAG TPA: hypothetical protein VKX16_07980 [Chloroflexota bacterium]|nr:hypothetical protein [Chloroflexota bacterium]
MESPVDKRAAAIPVARSRPAGAAARRLLHWGIPLLALALIAGGALLLVLATRGSSAPSPLAQDALAYGRHEMVWQTGPVLQSIRVIALRDLGPALSAAVPARVRQDVNVPDLIRRFGANRRVGLAILRGTFNSLPPDEGIVLTGDAVVLVDAKTGKGLYVNT